MTNSGTVNLYNATLDLSGVEETFGLMSPGWIYSYGINDTIVGTVINGGFLTVLGASLHSLTITGDYYQTGTGELSVRIGTGIAGSESDIILVYGDASLGGALTVTAFGELPESGYWTILICSTLSGEFAENKITLPGGVELIMDYDNDMVRLVKD